MFGDLWIGSGSAGWLVLVLLVGLVGFLMPFSMYAAQKWTYRSYQELEKLNQKFDELLVLTREEARCSVPGRPRCVSAHSAARGAGRKAPWKIW